MRRAITLTLDLGNPLLNFKDLSGKNIVMPARKVDAGIPCVCTTDISGKRIVFPASKIEPGDNVIRLTDLSGKGIVVRADGGDGSGTDSSAVDSLKSLTARIDPDNPSQILVEWVPGDNNTSCHFEMEVDRWPLKGEGEDDWTYTRDVVSTSRENLRYFAWHYIVGWGMKGSKYSKISRRIQVYMSFDIWPYLSMHVSMKQSILPTEPHDYAGGGGPYSLPMLNQLLYCGHNTVGKITTNYWVGFAGWAYDDVSGSHYNINTHFSTLRMVCNSSSVPENVGVEIVSTLPTDYDYTLWSDTGYTRVIDMTPIMKGTTLNGWSRITLTIDEGYGDIYLGFSFNQRCWTHEIPEEQPYFNFDIIPREHEPPDGDYFSGSMVLTGSAARNWLNNQGYLSPVDRVVVFYDGGYGRYVRPILQNWDIGWIAYRLIDPDNGIFEIWAKCSGEYSYGAWYNKLRNQTLYFGKIELCNNTGFPYNPYYHGFLGISLLDLT